MENIEEIDQETGHLGEEILGLPEGEIPDPLEEGIQDITTPDATMTTDVLLLAGAPHLPDVLLLAGALDLPDALPGALHHTPPLSPTQ